jgi:hypothetical protein
MFGFKAAAVADGNGNHGNGNTSRKDHSPRTDSTSASGQKVQWWRGRGATSEADGLEKLAIGLLGGKVKGVKQTGRFGDGNGHFQNNSSWRALIRPFFR